MEDICEELVAWLNEAPRVPVVYAAYHQAPSRNSRLPYLGLVYQDGAVCPWWKIGGVRHDFPPHHLALMSTHAGSCSADVTGAGGLWVCTFNLGRDGPLHLFERYHWETRPIRQPASLIHAYRRVAQAFLMAGSTQPIRLKAAVLQLLATLLDDLAGKAGTSHETLAPVLDFIQAHYQMPELELADLAAEAGLSIHHFGRVFRQATGTTPIRYLRDLRLRQAQALLAGTDLRIGEIAEAVGYRDPLHFSRAFRDLTGHSPRQWRRNQEPTSPPNSSPTP